MEIKTEDEMGGLVISEEVISSIATNAAKDVDGVSSFSNRPVDIVETIKKGSLKVMSPVRITEIGDDLDLSIYVNLESGTKITPVAEKIQKSVKDAIQNMTGKYVSKVNVIVDGIDFDEQDSSNEPTETED